MAHATVKLLYFVPGQRLPGTLRILGAFMIQAVERAAEPISASLERWAVRSPVFSSFCERVARAFRATTARERKSLFSDAPRVEEAPLTKRQATKLGAELLAEGSVVSLGLAVLYDSHRREENAEEVLEARIAALEATLASRTGKDG